MPLPSTKHPPTAIANRLSEFVFQQFRSRIARNATWMLGGQGLQLAAQVGYFVIIAHVLGPRGYGTFIACTAVVIALSTFSPWGTGDVMVKYVARDPKVLPVYFGNALLVTIGSGLALTLLAVLMRPLLLPRSASTAMVLAVAIADLIGTQATGVCSQAFLAVGRVRRSAEVLAFSAGLRFLAAMALKSIGATPMRWAYLYATAAMLSTVAAILNVSWSQGRPRIQLSLVSPSVREGFHFASAQAAQTVYTSIDKTMLARLGTVEAAAIYAVAERFIEAAMLPVRSLAAAAYPEFFRRGVQGVTSSYQFARNILRRSVAYGVAVGAALFLSAGLVPLIMGAAYADSCIALRWLCLLPVIKSIHFFLTDTLTGANYQWQRSSIQILVAFLNVILNLVLIREFSWRGAAWSSTLTNGALMLALYLIINWHLHREPQAVRMSASLAEGD